MSFKVRPSWLSRSRRIIVLWLSTAAAKPLCQPLAGCLSFEVFAALPP